MKGLNKESFYSIIENALSVAREETKKIKEENIIWQSDVSDPQFHTKTINHNLYISEFFDKNERSFNFEKEWSYPQYKYINRKSFA